MTPGWTNVLKTVERDSPDRASRNAKLVTALLHSRMVDLKAPSCRFGYSLCEEVTGSV